MMATAASVPALEWHAGQDHGAILRHNRALTAELAAAADDLGLTLLTPRPETERGGSIMLHIPRDLRAEDVLTALRAQDIYADSRGQSLRLSPGVMTSSAATQHLIGLLAGVLQA